MTRLPLTLDGLLRAAALCTLCAFAATASVAEPAKTAKPAPAKTAKTAPAKPVEAPLAEANTEQIEAAEQSLRAEGRRIRL